MRTQHVDPEEAVQIARDTGAQQSLGIHWNTFALTDEPYNEPAVRLQQALRAAAARTRQVAQRLRREGLSGRDIAAILHVSAQRVSQLLKSSPTSAH